MQLSGGQARILKKRIPFLILQRSERLATDEAGKLNLKPAKNFSIAHLNC